MSGVEIVTVIVLAGCAVLCCCDEMQARYWLIRFIKRLD